MSERKNIDTFFKERLEHFETAPPEMAWDVIEARLNEKKKKKRVIPFWWKFSGVAALLLLGFILFGTYYNSNTKPQNPIVNQENNTRKDLQKTGLNDKDRSGATQNTAPQNAVASAENTGVAPQNTSSGKGNSDSPALNKKPALSEKVQPKVASVSADAKNKKAGFHTRKTPAAGLTNEALAAASDHPKTKKRKSNTTVKSGDNELKPVENNQQLAQSNTAANRGDLAPQNAVGSNQKGGTTTTIEKENTTIAAAGNPAAKSDEIKKKDSTNLAVVEPNALEELLNEKEEKIAKERKENRWQVTPNIAPIYFSSMSNGSPLDEKLANNEKIYGTNYSYGVTVNYALNKKWQIRSGIHTFSADYDTKNIVFYQDANASRMQNVTPNLQGSLIQIDPLSNVNQSFGRLIGEKFEGTLNQRMGYVEMPLEVSYKVLAKKFGIDLIGGLSTLYLSQNDIYLKATGFTMKIGEANNLNTFHFSTNVGLGLKYSFFKRFDARVEPLFKYQLNTYSSGAGNFKPYVFGIYSGISYHF